MDTIFIDRLSIDTVIGIYDWERRIKQRVVLDLEMDFDIRAAAATDDVDRTLNYKAVAKRVIAFVEASEFDLVETLSERVTALILDEFPVDRVTLRLDKPHALRGARGVGIRITRERATVEVVVGIGSNIAPEAHVRATLGRLTERFGPLEVSPVYTCPAVGFAGADFINLVAAFKTREPIETVQMALREIEAAGGRSRHGDDQARTIDLDMLLFGDRIYKRGHIRVPRADILEYAFVLRPLADIRPEGRHPVDGRTYREIWADFDEPEQRLTEIALEF